jgi:hypothetical protein
MADAGNMAVATEAASKVFFTFLPRSMCRSQDHDDYMTVLLHQQEEAAQAQEPVACCMLRESFCGRKMAKKKPPGGGSKIPS